MSVDLLRGGAGGGQSLGQIRGIGWPRERIGGKRAGGLCLAGQTHIHKGIVFHDRGSFVGVKRRRWLE